jgi:hypothetical protein
LLFGSGGTLSFVFEANRLLRYSLILVIGLPIFLLLYYGIKEKEVKKIKESLEYEHFDKEFNHRQWFFSYVILTFVVLVTVILLQKK